MRKGIVIIPNIKSKAIFASSYVELEKGEEMHKSTAIVDPDIIKRDSFVIETQTGKKVEVVNVINPNDWIGMEYEVRKKKLEDLKFDVCKSCVILLGASLLICYFFSNTQIYSLYIGVLVIMNFLVLISGVGAIKTTSKNVKAFEIEIEEGMISEDMHKTIDMYFGYRMKDCVYSLLKLRHEMVYDIAFKETEGESIEVEILTINTSADIDMWFKKRMDVKRNVDIDFPQFVISPDGIKLKFPIEEK